MTADIITFGCRLNSYESEKMREFAEKEDDSTVIFNTCAVTNEAERQARQAIRKLKRERPEAKIIVTGCAAKVHEAAFEQMPEVAKVVTNKSEFKGEKKILSFATKSRAMVQIQQGCDHDCTFCIVPLARGINTSFNIKEIIEEINSLVDLGFKEITLTGVDICSYGQDISGQSQLGNLIEEILKQAPNLPRLRLSSLDPAGIDDKFINLISQEPRIMPHLHLSLQAGDDLILKRMKRRHNRAQILQLCQKLRQNLPGIALGADLIAGFPTETPEMFQNTLKLIEDCGLTHLHVFPYSRREGTKAAKMPQIAKEIRKERAAELRKLGEKALYNFMDSFINHRVRVLVEDKGQGYSEAYLLVKNLKGQEGELMEVEIKGREEDMLVAI